MIKIYDAANGIEAQLILNLFNQAGITGRIDGEYLQGGIGEIQPSGFVSLSVNHKDLDKAQEILRQWDAKETINFESIDSETKSQTNIKTKLNSIKLRRFFLVCFVFFIFSIIIFDSSSCFCTCFPVLLPVDYALLNLNSGILEL